MNFKILQSEVLNAESRNMYKCRFTYETEIAPNEASNINWGIVRSEWLQWLKNENNTFRYKVVVEEGKELNFRLPQFTADTYVIIILKTENEVIIDRGVSRIIDFTQRMWKGLYAYSYQINNDGRFEWFLMKLLTENTFTLTVEIDNIFL